MYESELKKCKKSTLFSCCDNMWYRYSHLKKLNRTNFVVIGSV